MRQGALLTPSTTNSYTQQELNFSMFWSISIMLYESLLVSDQSPFDKHMSGVQPFAANSPEARGLALFTGKGACVDCHDGPVLSTAAVVAEAGVTNPPLDPLVVERMLMASDGAFKRHGRCPLLVSRRCTSTTIAIRRLRAWCASTAAAVTAARCR